MDLPPKLPPGVTWDDVELIPKPGFDPDMEPPVVARNKKTGEIYD